MLEKLENIRRQWKNLINVGPFNKVIGPGKKFKINKCRIPKCFFDIEENKIKFNQTIFDNFELKFDQGI